MMPFEIIDKKNKVLRSFVKTVLLFSILFRYKIGTIEAMSCTSEAFCEMSQILIDNYCPTKRRYIRCSHLAILYSDDAIPGSTFATSKRKYKMV